MTSLTPAVSGTLQEHAVVHSAAAIKRSWERCAAIGSSLHSDPDPMPRADLQARREQHAHILRTAQPELETLAALVASAKSVVLLADAAGVILQEAGSTEFLRKAERVALRAGVSWAESLRGTNAIGTALIDGTATRVHGREHFLELNSILSCHAAPILSPRGETLGVLDISSEASTLHAYALGLAQMCATQISNRLLDNTDARLHRLVFQRESSLLDSTERAILLLEDERIVGANAAALHLLGSDWSLLNSSIHSWMEGCAALNDTPCTVHTRTGLQLLATLRHGRDSVAPKRKALVQAATSPASPAVAINAARQVELPLLEHEVDQVLAHASSAMNAGLAILLQGETGAGKEIFARHLHARSQWKSGPFVAVNCGALPESLIESELFGYEAGAFTGARREGSLGRLREAHGGILFLDEIGDMPLLLQTRLLRALQEREVQPLGSDKRIPVSFGVISASNRNLAGMIRDGSFRSDLFYRLQDYKATLPPLRERGGLRQFLCQEFARLGGTERAMTLADSALDALARYAWPGNYREMQSTLRSVLFLKPVGSLIHAADLPPELQEGMPSSTSAPLALAGGADTAGKYEAPCPTDVTGATLRDINEQAIQRVIEECRHNLSQAAGILGVHRSTLYRYLARSRSAPSTERRNR
jgi:transcriptional regulator of acetoin/glycerol metabolism